MQSWSLPFLHFFYFDSGQSLCWKPSSESTSRIHIDTKMVTNTSNNETTNYFGEEILLTQKQTYFYAILSFESALGLSGNILFLLSFIKAKNCASNMYVIMRGLSVVDIGYCLSLPLVPIQELLVKEYRAQYELCRYQLILQNACFLNNILHILLLGIDRYVAITRPHR